MQLSPIGGEFAIHIARNVGNTHAILMLFQLIRYISHSPPCTHTVSQHMLEKK